MASAIIQARMSSTRLPGKVLKKVGGKPLLHYMLERVGAARLIDKLIVATTEQAEDDPVAEFCSREGFECFRGSLDDVLDRYYQAARKIRAEVIVRMTGDCPVIDPSVIDKVIEKYQAGDYDFVANTAPPEGMTYPEGMDLEVFSYELLERAWRDAVKPSEREHVTFYFWKNPRLFSKLRCESEKDLSDYRFTVDYPEDFDLVKALIDNLYRDNNLFSLEDMVSFLDSNPQIRDINRKIEGLAGWKPSLDKDKQLGF